MDSIPEKSRLNGNRVHNSQRALKKKVLYKIGQIENGIDNLSRFWQNTYMFKRLLHSKILSLASQYPILALSGPCQAGKTTLAQFSFPDYQYVTLEDLDTREFASQDPRGLL